MGLFDRYLEQPPAADDIQEAATDDVGAEISARLKRLHYGHLPPDVHARMNSEEKFDYLLRAQQAYSDAVDHFVPEDGPTEGWQQKLVDHHDHFSKQYMALMDAARAMREANGNS
jgi:hypothetical protein